VPTPFPVETARLALAPVTAADLPALLPVYNSNPFFLKLAEGKPEVTLEDLARDFEDRGREGAHHVLLRTRDGATVGVVQVLEENPNDGRAWLGLLVLHAEWQRRGLAREVVEALSRWLRDNGRDELRLGVLGKNARVVAAWAALGFRGLDVIESERWGRVIRMARALPPEPGSGFLSIPL
jgi:RimJ/RimL family protein N-acetyltransferase